MAATNNVLQQVITFQKSGLAYLQNLMCFTHLANTKFKDFQNFKGQRGSTVSFNRPTRMTSGSSLVANFQDVEDEVETLTVDQAINVSYSFNASEEIYEVEDFMNEYGKAAIEEMASKIELNLALNCVTAPYRFYGDGVTPINSHGQLAKMLAMFRNYGAAKSDTKCILDDLAVPDIVNSGLNQFSPDRANKESMSWELGPFSNCDFYQSNLLPVHTAGTAGQSSLLLTVVSTTTNAAGEVTAITFSVGGAPGADPDMIKQHDKLQFQDGVAGQTNLRYLTYIGRNISKNPVQMRATADAASTAGSQVTVTIDPPLQAAATNHQNINTPIVAGQQVRVLPNHRAGLVMSGKPFYVGMPQLPDQRPYDTARTIDEQTGLSFRMTTGAVFGQNQRGTVNDAIWGSKLVAPYAMSVIFPV